MAGPRGGLKFLAASATLEHLLCCSALDGACIDTSDAVLDVLPYFYLLRDAS